MLTNYFKVAIRNLLKNRVFSFINIFGLAFGLCCAMLIALWVNDEYSFDKFHSKGDRIYKVISEMPSSSGSQFWTNSPNPLAEVLQTQYSGIEAAIHLNRRGSRLFKYEDVRVEKFGIYVDSTFFDVFDFQLSKGDPNTALDKQNSLLISEQLAVSLFGDEDPMGKVVNVGDIGFYDDMIVTGVIAEIPAQSSMQFDYLMPYAIHIKHRPSNTNWGNYNDETVVLLSEGADPQKVGEKIKDAIIKNNKDTDAIVHLYPFDEYYLKANISSGLKAEGKIRFVRLFGIIGVIILLIACINFMNLATAKGSKRAKEVGIRKTTGASRSFLIGQFLGESILMALLSGVIAVTFCDLLLPAFNELTEKSIQMPYGNLEFYIAGIGICLFTGVVAGLYPALYLSSFDPSKVLKGTVNSGKSLSGFRRVLVIIQFTLSIVFVICTIFVFNQIQFILNKDLGLSKENIVYHDLNGAMGHKEAYKEEVLKIPGVKKVAYSDSDPLWVGNTTSTVTWPGKPEDNDTFFHVIVADDDFIETFNMQLLEGRNFPKEPDTASIKLMLNEQAALAMGLTEPVGAKIDVWGASGEVVGLLKDFHHQSLFQKIEPIILFHYPPYAWQSFISIDGQNVKETIAEIEKLYLKYESNYPFVYDFVDANYERNYGQLSKIGILSAIFAVVAILVSCLGLFGLSSYMAEQRKKETGIRKVFGASVVHLTTRFSFQYFKLIIISFLASVPIVWYAADSWLNQFEYRIAIDIVPFLIGGIAALLIALATISYHIIATSLRNPIEALRYE